MRCWCDLTVLIVFLLVFSMYISVTDIQSIIIFVAGCNLEHAYCTKPGECLCDVGWSGENCTECIVQQKCPGSCNMPAGCVCTEFRQNGQGICRINDSPPSLTKNNFKHTMRETCFMYNKKKQIDITKPPIPPKPNKINIGKDEPPVKYSYISDRKISKILVSYYVAPN